MRRVLITGLAGFTGRHLAAEMAAHDWEVHGLGSQPAPDIPNYHVADLSDTPSLVDVLAKVQPQAVVHLAAIAFVGHGDADAFYRVNLLGTRHLLVALAAMPQPPTKVLLASSANVYGNRTEGVLDEDTPPQPSNDYAVSKLAMEHMARLWEGKLPITIARPFNYTGVGQSRDFLLPKIVAHFRERAPVIELGNLDVWRDFSDVRAVVQAYRRLLETDTAIGRTVNVCSGNTHTLRELLAIAEDITGHAIEVRVNPAFVRTNEVRTLSGNPARLRQLIGDDWQSPPLQETMRWMLNAP